MRRRRRRGCRHSGAGWVARPEDPESIAMAIRAAHSAGADERSAGRIGVSLLPGEHDPGDRFREVGFGIARSRVDRKGSPSGR